MSTRDPLHELKDALSFPVSADFCARVRQQVAAEPVRPRMFGVWGMAAAAAVVLSAGVGVITTLRHPSVETAEVGPPSVAVGAQAPVEPGQPAVATIEPLRVTQRSARVVASKTVTPFETVVPDDQLRALERLLAAMREGRATVPPVVADSELNERGERVLRALVIEPVTVNPIKDPNK